MRHNLAVVIVTVLLAGGAQAGIIPLGGALRGSNENPPNASPGTGLASVLLDDIAHMITIDATFSGLTGNTAAAHIHCCIAPPGNAGVATVVPAFPGFPLGVTAGTFHGVFNLLDPAFYNPTFITNNGGTAAAADVVFENGLKNGQTYFNIHTTTFGGGEIRALLFVTPEPATAPLALSAAAALWLLRRRKR